MWIFGCIVGFLLYLGIAGIFTLIQGYSEKKAEERYKKYVDELYR